MKRLAVLLMAILMAGCGSEQRAPAPVVTVAPSQPPSGYYLVQPGDSIYSVARELNLTVRALIDANQLRAPYQLQPGQKLLLPGGSVYLVGKGDNLSVIAKKTGVAFATLARMNGLSPPFLLQPGQKLLLPAGANAATPASAAVAPPPFVTPPPVAAAPQVAVSRSPLASPPPSSSQPPPPPLPAAAPVAAAPAAVVPPPAATTQPAPQLAATPLPLPAPPAKSGRGFIWPVKGELIAEYGSTGKGQHNDGINIAAPRGSAVLAAESGVVAYAGNELRGFGNLLLIKHDEGWMTAYAHNDQLLVRRGDVVRRGQKIATVGDSGGVSQPQLHFELRQGTRAIDPVPILAGKPLPTAEPADPG